MSTGNTATSSTERAVSEQTSADTHRTTGDTPMMWRPATDRSVEVPAEVTPLAFAELYPATELLSPPVQRALALLDQAVGHLDAAIEAQLDADTFGQANSVVLAATDLRELFCVREIGDGFGSVVNASLAGIENLQGALATRHQLHAVKSRLTRLRAEPFMTVTRSDDEIDLLEDAGLNVEPAGAEVLIDWLHGDDANGQ